MKKTQSKQTLQRSTSVATKVNEPQLPAQPKEKTLEELRAELDKLRKTSFKPTEEELEKFQIEEEKHKEFLRAADEGRVPMAMLTPTNNNNTATPQQQITTPTKQQQQQTPIQVSKQQTTPATTTPMITTPIAVNKTPSEMQASSAPNVASMLNNSYSIRHWKMDAKNKIIGFTLTDARMDLLNRLKSNQLYTLEECKVILKEIVMIIKADAEKDLQSLMFLSKFRTERLFPKPIVTDFVGNKGATVAGFLDTEDDRQLIYCNIPPAPLEKDANKAEPKVRLERLVFETNKNLIKIIDTALRQRKERMLLAATIIEELEEVPEIAKYLKRVQFENFGKNLV